MLLLRHATVDDVPDLVRVEAASWPAGLAADEQQVRGRIAAFAPGQVVAELDGQVVAVAWSQRISQAWWEQQPDEFDALTDRGTFTTSHDPAGDVYQLIGVGVSPAGRGARLGRRLVDHEIDQARSLPGVRRIVGYTRPVGFADSDLPIDEYAALCDGRGRPVDPMLAFHLGAGARLVSIHAGFRPADVAARGYGVLIEYPLQRPNASRSTDKREAPPR